MDKTPIQIAIDFANDKIETYTRLLKLSFTKHETSLYESQRYGFVIMKNQLQSLLPTERQFAETCFDAGVSSERNLTNNFDNFFKKYTHD